MRPIGWKYDSARHSLAARGIQTRRYNMATNVRLPQYQIAEIKARLGQEAANEAKRRAVEEHLTAKQLADEFNVPYVRKLKFEQTPDRAYQPGQFAVSSLEEGPRGGGFVPDVQMSEAERLKLMMRVDGVVYLRNEMERLNDMLATAKRRLYVRNYELTKAIEKAKNDVEVRYLQSRLADAQTLLRDAESRVEHANTFKGHEEDFLPSAVRDATIERVVLAPKRTEAIEEAKMNPVVVAALAPPTPKVPERALQLRLVKFMAMKKKFSLGERIVGAGMITQSKVFKNREKKVYGRIMGNR